MKLRYLLPLLLVFSFSFSQKSYHDTQGKLEISSSGQAVYTLPIALPPSIQSVGPTVNLVYSSGQMGGLAGQGWNLSAVSSITRISTRKDIDGFIDGVDFDVNDKLAIDGQRLLLVSGDYWADGSVYQTEVQSNTRIQLKGTGSFIYFIVTATDGSKSYYGNYGGTNAKDSTAFYIVRFEDTKGNFINYSYTPFINGCFYLDNIKFSGNTNISSSSSNKIVFKYEDAVRSESYFIKGSKVIKNKILNNIEVYTNDKLFRKYQLIQEEDNHGYQRVKQIQEFNGAGEAANPVVFDYDNTTTGIEIGENQVSDLNNLVDIKTTGDFDGDSKMDFILNNKLYTKMFENNQQVYTLPFTETKRLTYTGTTITNNKLNQKQSIINTIENADSIVFQIFNLTNTAVLNDYSKTILLNNQQVCIDGCSDPDLPNPTQHCTGPIKTRKTNEYLEGDFNGDGLSEVLIFTHEDYDLYGYEAPPTGNKTSTTIQEKLPVDPNPNPCILTHVVSENFKEVRIIDLNPNSSVVEDTAGYSSLDNYASYFKGDKRLVSDFNGDGKADVFVINNDKTYKIISFNQLLVSPWVEAEIIGQGSISHYSNTKEMLFGDYNGDGKTDIMLPEADGVGCEDSSDCEKWYIYTSNPSANINNFFEMQYYYITDYMPEFIYPSGQTYCNKYLAVDTDKDGKTDLVRVQMRLYDNSGPFEAPQYDVEWNLYCYNNNIGNNQIAGYISNKFPLDYSSPTYNFAANKIPAAFTTNYKYNGINTDLIIVQQYSPNAFGYYNKMIEFVNFSKNFVRDNSLKRVKQSDNAIVDEITYAPLAPGTSNFGYGVPNDFYSSNNSVFYPSVEIKQMPTIRLVSKLQNTTLGVTKSQSFKYNGYVVQFGGVGTLGFNKTARSNWYADTDTKQIWNVYENDATIRSALKRSYLQIVDSGTFGFAPNSSVQLGTLSDVVNDYSFISNSPYTLLQTKQTSNDYMTNVKTEKETQYSTDGYYIPEITVNKKYHNSILESTNTSTTFYDNSTPIVAGVPYYIGRPNKVVNTNDAYGDTKVSDVRYTYDTSGDLIHTETRANNDLVVLIEDKSYYPNHNLHTVTRSATGTNTFNQVQPRTTSYSYDASDRYVASVTDIQGLVSTTEYDDLYGVVLNQKNLTLNRETNSKYDSWGKRTSVKDFLGNFTFYTYTRNGGIFTTEQKSDDGSMSRVYTDVLGKTIKKGTLDINSSWSYVDFEYDYLGRAISESQPYTDGDTPTLFTTYSYDDYSRLIQTNAFTGKVTTLEYNGLSVKADDQIFKKTTTKDSNGLITSVEDEPGGIIRYFYDASGNQIKSDYDGIVTQTFYDNWGRKIELRDPSAGIYYYNYNAFGELKRERTPKGETNYELDDYGKLITKHITGLTATEKTDIKSTYIYDANKLLKQVKVEDLYAGTSEYKYEYEPTYFQLLNVEERLPKVIFRNETTLDGFGRTDTETYKAEFLENGKTSEKTIRHIYKNGRQFKVLDEVTQVALTTINTVDQRQSIIRKAFGNGVTLYNEYDDYGFPILIQHDSSLNNIMTIKNEYEPVKGNLINRYNSMFDFNETFKYDALDRLIVTNSSGQNVLTATFTNTTEGFQYVGNTNGYAIHDNGKLKVKFTSVFDKIKKEIYQNPTAGKVLNVKADVTKISGAGNANVVIREFDAVTNDLMNEEYLSSVDDGFSSHDYTTVADNTNVFIYFEGIDAQAVQATGGTSSFTGTGPNPSANTLIFTIDNLRVNLYIEETQEYDDRGRIDSNNTIGTYKYGDPDHPYQVTDINDIYNPVNTYFAQDHDIIVDYNAFKSPILIENQDIAKINFDYNYMQQRSVMYYGGNQQDPLQRRFRKYYSADGSMEVKYDIVTQKTEFITYIDGTAYDADVVYKKEDLNNNYFYLHRDQQGSILAITDSHAVLVEKRHFDAWGTILEVADGSNNSLNCRLKFFDRGYTGHEHLQSVGLIHMNARLYDPHVHRFLQPDTFIEDPYNTQNYNRYGYCVNNPLKYTDVTGNIFGLDDALLIGAGLAIASYLVTSALNHTPLKFYGVMTSLVVGTISTVATFGVGEVATTITSPLLKAGFQSFAHGMVQGGMSNMQGGNFWTGFASGSLSSLAASGWENTTGNFGSSGAGTMVFGALAGGAGASLTGGNFWQGAVTGLVVSGLNHVAHEIIEQKSLREYLEGKNIDPDGKTAFTNKALNEFSNKAFPEMITQAENPIIETIETLPGDEGITTGWTYNSESDCKVVGRGKILISRSAFLNNLKLASTIGHELSHAIDLANGNMSSWLYKGTMEYAKSKSEDKAYSWEKTMQSPYYSSFNHSIHTFKLQKYNNL
jgi:RHS repeat-associated protein